jgi:hypothetical protein
MPIYPSFIQSGPGPSSTVAAATIAAATTSQTLRAANTNRKGLSILNNSTAPLFVHLGATASLSVYSFELEPGDLYEMPYLYTGVVSGIWSAVNGSALVREFT